MLVFESCDLLDVGGPYEVLLTANRLAARRSEPEPFGVVVVAPGDRAVTAYGGLGLTPSATLDDRYDLVVVPGLVDVPAALADDHLVAAVAQLADRAEVVASICTGAFLLAAAGQLRDRVATTHHEDLADLAARDDVGEVRAGVRWVDSGTVVTGAGLSSGLATGLHLVDRFAGRELATATAAQIEHPWSPAEGITV
jgi:transcriptional regulator GlxA family with amidase domain